MNKLKLFGILTCVFVNLASYAQDIFPYLQTPQPNSIYVNWKTDFANIPAITYGTDPMDLGSTVTGFTSEFLDGGYADPYFYNTVQIVGLTPNTKYYYTVNSDGLTSDTLSFKTLPNPGEATADGPNCTRRSL